MMRMTGFSGQVFPVGRRHRQLLEFIERFHGLLGG